MVAGVGMDGVTAVVEHLDLRQEETSHWQQGVCPGAFFILSTNDIIWTWPLLLFCLKQTSKTLQVVSLIILEPWNLFPSLDGRFNIFNQITWISEQKTRLWEVNFVANGTSGSLFIWDKMKIILYTI